MRRVTRNGVIAVAAASGAMAVVVPAYADSAADGSTADSPGLISGNTVQLPVHVPVNVCGNTVNVVGLLNPAAGNNCVNEGGGTASGATTSGGSGARSSGLSGARSSGASGATSSVGSGATSSSVSGATSFGGATAHGGGKDSPGLLSGNVLQLPLDVPVNVSGNAVNVVGVGNPATGNTSVNTPADHPAPERPAPPRAAHPTPPVHRPQSPPTVALAHTGADLTAPAGAASAVLLVTGAVLYRRFRPRPER
ncbi:chaplin [Streptomyces sp. NPDC086549]|uniref:chaplin n=1 Tax=Streptomyces sp. NPDC086549 TaxID=3365752 RepID=UPI0038131F89